METGEIFTTIGLKNECLRPEQKQILELGSDQDQDRDRTKDLNQFCNLVRFKNTSSHRINQE